MKVAILQSSYIPWKGYFDIINKADLFIFYDDVQFTIRDWRSRNRIKCRNGLIWLSVPCGGDRNRLICDVEIKGRAWQRKHWDTIRHCYGKAEYFSVYRDLFEGFYLRQEWSKLSDMNQYIIKKIAHDILDISTEFADSRIYAATERKDKRLLELLESVGATTYISGPSAKTYIDENDFIEKGIELIWMDYSCYPKYRQLHPPFVHEVSIIDLIFNEGPNAINYIKSIKTG